MGPDFLWCVFLFPQESVDYRGGWNGESIDFAVFFKIWKWFAHEATNHDCPKYYIFYTDVVSFQECLIFCLAFWKRKTCLNTMILMPAMNSALYCRTYYHMYI